MDAQLTAISKAAGEDDQKPDGFALAPQCEANRLGLSNRRERHDKEPVRPGDYTPALRGLSTNWVDVPPAAKNPDEMGLCATLPR
jgi:hypothetical protein